MLLLTWHYTVKHHGLIHLVPFVSLPLYPAHITAYPSLPSLDLSCSLPPLHLDPFPLLCTCANITQIKCYPYTVLFLHRTPPIFYHYHSLLELQKHQLCRLSSYLLSIHLDLIEFTHYIHSFCNQSPVHVIPEPIPFFTISIIGAVPHHHTNFNPWKLSFNPKNSRANTPKVCQCTVPHIIQQDGHPFPSSEHSQWCHLIQTMIPYLFPINFIYVKAKKLELSFSENIPHFLLLHSPIYSTYISCT